MILMYSYSKETNWVTNVLVSENKLKVGQIVTVSCQFELATPSVDIAVANAHRSLIDTVIIREGNGRMSNHQILPCTSLISHRHKRVCIG